MSSTTGGVAPPRALTVLRLKRPRSATPLSSLHVSLPLHKRPPSLAPLLSALSLSLSAPHIRFRRLAAERAHEALQQPGVTIVDVQPDVVRRGVKRRMEAGEGGRKSARMEEGMLCNGTPMMRVTVDEEDVYVREGDVIGEDTEAEGKQEECDDPSSDSEMAYVRAEDLPEFVFDEEHSEEECDEEDDLDGESVDYPSTPETVSEGESEEWFEESRPFGTVPRAVQHAEYVQFASDEDAEYDGEGYGDEGEDS